MLTAKVRELLERIGCTDAPEPSKPRGTSKEFDQGYDVGQFRLAQELLQIHEEEQPNVTITIADEGEKNLMHIRANFFPEVSQESEATPAQWAGMRVLQALEELTTNKTESPSTTGDNEND